MEKTEQKIYFNAIVCGTGKRISVIQDMEGSPFFVDTEGGKHHISTLDLSDPLPTYRLLQKKDKQMKSLMDIMKTFDVKGQDDHRAKITAREYWMKLRGSIAISMLKIDHDADYKWVLEKVDYIVKKLKEQDMNLFHDS